MNTSHHDPAPGETHPSVSVLHRIAPWRYLPRWIFVLACVATLCAGFYVVEDWRGKRAWDRCRRELEAKGAVLDWGAYAPAPVPDQQNIFAAPIMSQWFVGRGSNPFSARFGSLSSSEFAHEHSSNVVGELRVMPLAGGISSTQADLVLEYKAPVLTISTTEQAQQAASVASPIIPVLIVDDTPLRDVISSLAKQAHIELRIDANVSAQWQGGKEPRVSLNWKNIAAREALEALLNNYQLCLVENTKTGVARVAVQELNGQVIIEASVRREIKRILTNAIVEQAADSRGPSAKAAQNFTLLARPLILQTKPARITIRADTPPGTNELGRFFPKDLLGEAGQLLVRPGVQPNSFQLVLGPPPWTAADYLAWSDQFQPDFDSMQEALKRPYARMPGDYSFPANIPIPNFITMRIVAQTLAQRAQCYMLLGQPENALRELTLIHNLCRLLEGKPSGKPMTLVAAMINVAVQGLYVATVADGFRLQAWREPQLIVLEQQLGEISLPPLVLAALDSERAATCRIFSTTSHAQLRSLFSTSVPSGASLAQKIRDPLFLFMTFAPRGWIYQNMTTASTIHTEFVATFDVQNGLVLADRADQCRKRAEVVMQGFSPYTFLAAMAVPNFVRAIQTTARNQTKANLALVACALERYRLAHGDYPDTLDRLKPQFAGTLPHDLIGGQPLKYRQAEPGRFVLYSIGWNQRDDGGIEGKQSAPEDADWVWDISGK